MGGSFGPIHHEQLFEWITQSHRQFVNARLELPILQGFVLVEEWHDEDGYHGHHNDGEDKHKGPHVDVKVLAAHLDIEADVRDPNHE